jgi:hypothetical protein
MIHHINGLIHVYPVFKEMGKNENDWTTILGKRVKLNIEHNTHLYEIITQKHNHT